MRTSTVLASAVIATLLACVLAVATAHAAVTTFARAGSWQAFGGSTNDGKRVCGMSSQGPGMWFGVKYFKGNTGLTVQMSSRKWTLKKGAKVKLEMRFDSRNPWSVVATGFHMTNGNGALQFTVPGPRVRPWMAEFRGASKMTIEFPNQQTVASWSVDLRGTTSVSNAMAGCIDAL